MADCLQLFVFFYEPGRTQVSECKAVMKMESTKPLLFNMEKNISLYVNHDIITQVT